jgi:hypothetical protein
VSLVHVACLTDISCLKSSLNAFSQPLDAGPHRLCDKSSASRQRPSPCMVPQATFSAEHGYLHQMPGKMAYLLRLYLSPNSLRYLLSFFHAQTPIWPTATMMKMIVLKLQLTSATPIHAIASNM